MASKKPLITFRPTTVQDLAEYKKWLQQPGVLEGFPMSDEREIDDAIQFWHQYLKRGTSITALYKKKPVGTSNLYIPEIEKLRHQCLFVIIVDQAYQRRGIGTLLLKEMQKLAKQRFQIEILHLEVYDRNPVIRLYKRMGFKQYAEHLNYLKDSNGTYYTKISMEMEL